MVLYIIDDEKTTRDIIYQHIAWDTIGIKEVVTAKNGIDALEKMQTIRPDIILSDVRMPKMNGIELAEEIRKHYPECVIIFLSGYADTEYLKSAIKIKALQYIEKPIDLNAIKSVVQQAVVQKRNQDQYQQKVEYLEDFYDKNLAVFKQNLLNRIISKELSEVEILQTLDKHHIHLNNKHLFTLVYLRINWPNSISVVQKREICEHLLQFTNTVFYSDKLISAFDKAQNLILLVCDRITQINQESLLLPLIGLINDYDATISYSFGISQTYTDLLSASQAYNEANTVSLLQFYKGFNETFFYNTVAPSSQCIYDENLFSIYREFLMENNKKNTMQHILQMRSHFNHQLCPVDLVKSIYHRYLEIIFEAAKEKEISLAEQVELTENQLYSALDEGELLLTVHSLLNKVLESYFACLDRLNEIGSRAAEIIKYINTHLSDNQLSVSTIACHFELSQAYLCSYFKKVVSSTINQYITEARLQKAMKLLSDTNFKVYEISDQVGISDTNYFSYLFKKHVGISPLEYKERHN